MTDQDQALLELLGLLKARGYRFVTPTPETHKRVLRRVRSGPPTLRDVFGWSLAFGPDDLDDEIIGLMADGGVLSTRGRRLVSRVRVSSLGNGLYIHSAFPPKDKDAVFFGPDSYRFAAFIESELAEGAPAASLVDVGAGAGVGALTVAKLRPDARVVMTDVNETALRYARINAAFAGVRAEYELDDGLDHAQSRFDLVLANPPYIAGRTGADGRTYRDGGDMLGAALSVSWAEAAMDRLSPGGRLLLYTGSAIVAGEDRLRAALERAAQAHGCDLRYRELDPDVFGEELSRPVYREAERIAVVGAVAARRA